MIEWMIVFFIISQNDPTIGTSQIAKTTEPICRQMAADFKPGQDFTAVVMGVEVPAKFQFCMWSRDGIIEDFVKAD